jgi:hypothetical protein
MKSKKRSSKKDLLTRNVKNSNIFIWDTFGTSTGENACDS